MRTIVAFIVGMFVSGCYPTKESFSACCSTCQSLAAICTQAAAVYVETDRPLAIAASKECLGAYAACRESCKL